MAIRQKHFCTWSDLVEARENHFYEWDAIAHILGKACRRPDEKVNTPPCGNPITCAYCKLRADASYSPSIEDKQVVGQGLRALIQLQQKHNWITTDAVVTLQNLFNNYAQQTLQATDRTCV